MPSSTYYAVLLALVLGVGCGGSKEGKAAHKPQAKAKTPAASAPKEPAAEDPKEIERRKAREKFRLEINKSKSTPKGRDDLAPTIPPRPWRGLDVSTLSSLAEKGNSEAQWRLALESYKRDYKALTLKWLRKAAEQNHINAQHTLGRSYYYGLLETERDEKEALKWLEKAAGQGHGRSKIFIKEISRQKQGRPGASQPTKGRGGR